MSDITKRTPLALLADAQLAKRLGEVRQDREEWFSAWQKAQIKCWTIECIAVGAAAFAVGLLIGGLFL